MGVVVEVPREDVTVAADEDPKKKKAEEKKPKATIPEFYQFASGGEKLMLVIAAFAATGSGLAMPMMLIAFGDAFDGLGVSETISGASYGASFMDQMLLTFIWIALGIFGGRFLYLSFTDWVCSNQLYAYKKAYLKAVLRQGGGCRRPNAPDTARNRRSARKKRPQPAGVRVYISSMGV